MTTPLPEGLIKYLESREAFRAKRITDFLASLTDRELVLISDIAVMGYVRGTMHPRDEPHPKRNPVLAEVIDACFAFPDKYPAIDAAKNHTTSSRVEYFVEVQQPDLSWLPATGKSEDLSYIKRQAGLKKARNPDWDIRIGWSVTSVTTGSISWPDGDEED